VQLLLAAFAADFAAKLRRAACCGHNGNLSASWLFVFRFSPQAAEEVKAVANWPIEDCETTGIFPPFFCFRWSFSYESETETPCQPLAHTHFILFIVFDKFAFNFGRSVAVQNPLSLLLPLPFTLLPFLTLSHSAIKSYTGKEF